MVISDKHDTKTEGHASIAKDSTKKSAYYKALLAAKNICTNNEPGNVEEARGRPDWQKWKDTMDEELNSLE